MKRRSTFLIIMYNVPNGGLLTTEKKTYIGLDQANLSLAYTFNLNNKRK